MPGDPGPDILADEVSISLLFIREGLKVLLNLQSNHGRGLVGKIVDQLLSVHVGRKSLLLVSERTL